MGVSSTVAGDWLEKLACEMSMLSGILSFTQLFLSYKNNNPPALEYYI